MIRLSEGSHAISKKYWFIKACSSSFHENNDEDLKVIHVTPTDSMFSVGVLE